MFEKLKNKVFGFLSRSQWAIRLLNLPMCKPGKMRQGLILIQIDGLSFCQLEQAIEKGKMPFLNKLLHRDKTHKCRSMYSGIPSSTPAVQGELFYGVPTVVPAFEFIDRKENRRHVGFNPETADFLANELKQKGPPLLRGGHVYATIFSGGAKQARYCSETMDLDTLIQSLNPLKLLVMLILHAGKLMRIFTFALVEVVLALQDFIRGIIRRQDIVRELTFIPARVLVCIILRELVRFRLKMDVTQGIELVCANFLGYDEQSHRRGPESAFAHWSLKGIDDTLKDIYRTAEKSTCLEYDLVVYSDHGQEHTRSYEDVNRISVKKAIKKNLAEYFPQTTTNGHLEEETMLDTVYRKIRSFGLKPQKPGKNRPAVTPVSGRDIQVTTMGPLGHVYFPYSLTDRQMHGAALKLVRKAGIPQVFFLDKNRKVMAATPRGTLPLTPHKAKILGKNHPFLDLAAQDLARVCRHPNAGNLVISGWLPGEKPLSFNTENGAHGGPGMNETHAFTILPAKFPVPEGILMRPRNLRTLLERHLRTLRKPKKPTQYPQKMETGLSVVTHNIHSCLNLDRRCDPDRTAGVLSALNPDIVALQEVDVGCRRTGFMDQAAHLARSLDMFYHFYPLVDRKSGQYGIAILSRYPIVEIECRHLACTRIGRRAPEQRGIMSAIIETPFGPVRFINTHLGLKSSDRAAQIKDIILNTLMPHPGFSGQPQGVPLIFCGDLNAGPKSAVYRSVSRYLNDVQVSQTASASPKPTFFSWFPVRRIDHIFVSSHFHTNHVFVPKNHTARMVSDHLPVSAEIGLISSGKDK
jgi:endonuclease/exonuclease/phosphatase family metal-dependent hydrolase